MRLTATFVFLGVLAAAADWDELWTVGEINYWSLQFDRALQFSDFDSDGKDITGYCHDLYTQAITALEEATWAWHNFPRTGTVRGDYI